MDGTKSPEATAPPLRARSSSHVSHVDVGFFDQTGVQELRKTLSRHQADAVPPGSQLESYATSMQTVDNEKALAPGRFNFEQTLRETVQKRTEAQIQARELGVMFRDLHVVGVGSTSSYQPTMGTIFSPSHIVQNIQDARHPPLRDILTGFEGVVRPGEMLLVLGRPGAGCSTLLKVLSNHRSDYHSVTGDVKYDSISPEDMQKQFRGDVQYCPEDDVHFPTLTVDQTIKFAAKMRTPRSRLVKSREEHIQLETDILTTIFGLRHAKDTVVGDAFIRGISGGEKKRVSIAEALAARSCINAWDNSTRGLDSSTALEFIQALRIATDVFRTTTIVTLYQAGESLYQHFDKVCVVYEGKMAYFGPADRARQYFIDLGYEPANRQTTADFLVSVTDPGARIPRAHVLSRPRTAVEFNEHFRRSTFNQLNKGDIQSYEHEFVGKEDRASAYTKSAHAEHARGTRNRSPYITSIAMQTRAVMLRRVQMMWGNKIATFLNLFSFAFQAVIIGSVFFKLKESTDAYFSRGGVLFFAILFTALATMAEIPALFAQRPIVNRHEKAALYHPFVEALALTLVDIPITFVVTVFFGVVLYFMTGLQRTAGQFFIYYLFVFSTSLVMKNWFRAVAAGVKQEPTALTIAGISILTITLYSSYVIPKPTMIGALRWISYLNPVRYSFEALLTNEYRTLNGTCTQIAPQGPGYENVTLANQVCTVVGALPGQAYVEGSRFVFLSYGFTFDNLWRNFGIVAAFGIAFFIALLAFTERNTSTYSSRPIVLFNGGRKARPASNANDEEGQKKDSKLVNDDVKVEGLALTTDIFSWQHLNYTIPIPGEADKQLLQDISGYVAPGKLTALMGESGAGKTTLLNVLAQRADFGVVSGDMFVNGQGLPQDFQSQTGYCQQQDTHVPTATVREALIFSAKLRQPQSVPMAEKIAYVDKCITLCGLEQYANAAVGTLDTEQRKRTTIAVELAAKPKLLLFLDEPTTGLDSQSAWAILAFLRNLADHGQAILCTIHQPSAELFQVFDRLLLLRKGGQTVYFGDVGQNATTMIHYFERNGARRCLAEENPAEYMLDIIGAGANATASSDWNKIWRDSHEADQLQEEIEAIHVEGRKRPPPEAAFCSEFATSWWNQLVTLYQRDARTYWRDTTYTIAKLVLNIMFGLYVGFTFFHSKSTQQGTQNKLFAIFMVTILSVPLANQLQIPFIRVRTVYEIRERPSRIYSWTALIASQILIEIPWNIFGTSILFCCWYWTVGFDTDRAGYTYLMMSVVFPLYYTTIGQAVAAMAPNIEIAAMLFSLIFSFVITFNGVMQPFSQLGWWQWMYRLSPYTYLIEGLLGQVIGHQEIHCSAVEFVTLNPPSGMTCGQYMNPFLSSAGGYLTNPNATSECQLCGLNSSDSFLKNSFNMFYSHHWRNFGFMIAFVLFNIACTFLFTYLFRIHKGSFFSRPKKTKS
ncbi:hypothetical protein BDN72DRAFT_957578 [Pluteus cervinus]|uniref:Uncharacterized protein n=1 Tax=Pluteus cervinus TaxID=181527 RepID=A0ACD3B2B6_9AGAR|nr:hypothetical protein BDN72DRAFT_957578 [Pluteus cervinus]